MYRGYRPSASTSINNMSICNQFTLSCIKGLPGFNHFPDPGLFSWRVFVFFPSPPPLSAYSAAQESGESQQFYHHGKVAGDEGRSCETGETDVAQCLQMYTHTNPVSILLISYLALHWENHRLLLTVITDGVWRVKHIDTGNTCLYFDLLPAG